MLISVLVAPSMLEMVGNTEITVSSNDYHQMSETDAIIEYGGRWYRGEIKKFDDGLSATTIVAEHQPGLIELEPGCSALVRFSFPDVDDLDNRERDTWWSVPATIDTIKDKQCLVRYDENGTVDWVDLQHIVVLGKKQCEQNKEEQ